MDVAVSDFLGSLFLVLAETDIRIRAVLEKRLNNGQDGVFRVQVDSVIGIPHDAVQRGVTVRIDEVGIGAIVEQQVDGLRVTHGAGDHQRRQPRFRLGVIRFRAGAEQNAGAVHIAFLGGEHQRREAGF